MKSAVLDASVTACWILTDESESKADDILKKVGEGKLDVRILGRVGSMTRPQMWGLKRGADDGGPMRRSGPTKGSSLDV